MPGVHCGLAACWQLLFGLRVSLARDMVRVRNAAGWASSRWRGRGVEGRQRLFRLTPALRELPV